MAEQFRGKPDSERTSSRDVSGAPHGADEPDVDAFLRQPRLSLTDEYWRPVDSLIPVRLTDMRDEEPAPPPRRRVRALDAVIAGVGLGAVSLLVVLLLRNGDTHPPAHAVQSKTEVPRATATAPRPPMHAAVVAPPPAHPVPTATETAPTNSTATEAASAVPTVTEATSAVPTAAEAASPAQAATEPTNPAQVATEPTNPVQTTAPASNAQASIVAASTPTSAATTAAAPASSSSTETSSTEPKPAKKHKRKHGSHAPPTASFPDP